MNLSEFKSIADDFRNLNPRDVGAWPLAPRLAVLLALFVVIVIAGWWFVWRDQIISLEARQAEESQLKDQYLAKKKQAVNLDLYVQQLNEIDRSFGALLKQLPNRAEVESLLVEINQAGLGRGLQFELFRPGAEAKHDFYAELPISIKVTGTYHDIGAFASDIGRMSRIVTLNNMTIAPGAGGGSAAAAGAGDLLTMDALTKTFRYLDEEEVAAQRKSASKTAPKKK